MYACNISIVSSQNVPSSRGHMRDYPICPRDSGTKQYILYIKGEDRITYCDGNYTCGGFKFSLKDGFFCWKESRFLLPQRTNISTIERLFLSLGFQICSADKDMVVDLARVKFKEVLECIVSLALIDLNIVSTAFSFDKKKAYGVHVLAMFIGSQTGAGKIPSDNPHVRWMNEQDTLQLKSTLFKTSGYSASSHSMKYEPTELAYKLFSHAFELLKAVDFKHTEVRLQCLDFIVDIDKLSEIKTRDTMLLLKDCVHYSAGFVIRPKPQDKQDSRVYSVFTHIGSDARKKLGFLGYDIGSACQTICMQLVSNASKYPMHQALIEDKNAFRALIAEEMGQSIQWAKIELNKADNMETMPKKYKRSKTLTDYSNESVQLRKEIIQSAEPDIYGRANDYARTKKKKVWNSETEKYDFIDDGKKESSIFFFVWTQWERQIRHAMMACFQEPKACHEVHDAVYSKEVLEPNMIEEKVLEQTGFKVKISTD